MTEQLKDTLLKMNWKFKNILLS